MENSRRSDGMVALEIDNKNLYGYEDIEKYAEFKLDRQLSRIEREQE